MEPEIESASQVKQTTLQSTGTLTKDDWVNQYWFSPLQMVTVINPLDYDWEFMVEMRHFIIKAGAHEKFPGTVANVYLDQMSRILAQNEDKLGYMGDYSLKRVYYDRLIVAVDSLVPEYDPTPAYLRPTEIVENKPVVETPPWEAPVTPPVAESAPEPPKPESKEFEQDGVTYKLVVTSDGRRLHYKNGKMTTEAEYSKAASMI